MKIWALTLPLLGGKLEFCLVLEETEVNDMTKLRSMRWVDRRNVKLSLSLGERILWKCVVRTTKKVGCVYIANLWHQTLLLNVTGYVIVTLMIHVCEIMDKEQREEGRFHVCLFFSSWQPSVCSSSNHFLLVRKKIKKFCSLFFTQL